MLESSYYIDAGAWNIRLYDPKTRTIYSTRSCRLQKNPKIWGREALEKVWESNSESLVYPFSDGQIQLDPGSILTGLFEKYPTDRCWMIPSLKALCPDDSQEQTDRWIIHCLSKGFRSVSLLNPFACGSIQNGFHIHAGASRTHFVLYSESEIIEFDSISLGGLSIDRAIASELARVFKVLITPEDAAALKEAASNAMNAGKNATLTVTGLDQHNQYVQISFKAADLWGCMESVLSRIVSNAAGFICRRGPEVMERALSYPVTLSGGLASCFGLAQLLETQLKTAVHVTDHPDTWMIDQYAKAKNRIRE